MCSGSEAGSYLRLIDFVCHSTLGLRVIKKKTRETVKPQAVMRAASQGWRKEEDHQAEAREMLVNARVPCLTCAFTVLHWRLTVLYVILTVLTVLYVVLTVLYVMLP